jgi:hypothetical protein
VTWAYGAAVLADGRPLCWVAWIWLLILSFSDLFRRDVSGCAKAAWVASVIVLPLLGALVYVIAHGKEMTERRIRDTAASQAHEALA